MSNTMLVDAVKKANDQVTDVIVISDDGTLFSLFIPVKNKDSDMYLRRNHMNRSGNEMRLYIVMHHMLGYLSVSCNVFLAKGR